MENKTTALNTISLTEELQTAFSTLYRILSSCPDALLNKKTNEASWSPAQVTRHIIKASMGIPDAQTKPADRPADAKEATLKEIFLNMETKMQSPDFIKPEEKEYTKEELQEDLTNNLETLTAVGANKELTAVCMDFDFPGVGHMTRYEWLKFILFHTQRHTMQLHNTILALHEKN